MYCKGNKTKILALLLSVVIVVALAPVTVLAAGDAPILTAAEVNETGDVELTFNMPMADPDGNEDAFSLRRNNGTLQSLSSVGLKSGDNKTITLIPMTKIKGGYIFDISYDATKGNVKSSDNKLLLAIVHQDIINNLPHPTIMDATLPAATLGTAYTYTFDASGGSGSYSYFKYNGNLPLGLAIDNSGTLSGTPSTYSGTYTFKLQVTDGIRAIDIREFTIKVDPAVTSPGGPTGEAVWHARSPLPSAKIIEDIEYINDKYMALGYNGTLITSNDGVDWQKIQVGEDLDYLRGMAYGDGKYVIVGNAGDNDYAARIYTSNNGTDWHETAAVPHHRLNDVAYGEGKFVAVGMYGKILVSENGEDWVTKTVTYPDKKKTTLQSIIYSDAQKKFVAAGTMGVSDDHRGGIMTSEDGENWTVTYSDTGNSLWDVTYGNGIFVAVGGKETGTYFSATSSDGESWMPYTSYSGYAQLFSVKYDGARFIAAGRTPLPGVNAFTAISTDGVTWTNKTDSGLPGFRAVASNGTQLVAMGSYGNIYTSDNLGTNWNYQTLGTTKTLKDVAWNGSNLYVAVGVEGTIQTSPDGQTWTIQTSNTTNDLNKVDYLNGRFIAVGKSGTILSSTDGTDWTTQSSETTQELKGLAYGGGKYVVVGGDDYYNPIVLTSDDNGTSWSTVSNDPAFINITFVTATYGDGVFVALMKNGQGYQSDNGTTWTRIADLPGTSTQYPTDITYAGGKLAAVGGYGKIYLSSDKGDNWTTVDSGLSIYSWGITEGGGNFVATGDNGRIIASADGGTTWLAQPSGLTLNHYYINEDIRLNGIVAGDNCFVAVGENGLVLQSADFTVSTDVDAHDVSIDITALGFNNILKGNDNAGEIVKDMNLPGSGSQGTDISWASSKPGYIAADGKVIRPSFSDGDQVVYLTATITKNSASETKTFVVVVRAYGDPDISDVQAAAAALTFDTIKGLNTAEDNITYDLILPISGAHATGISWTSSNNEVIEPIGFGSGKVTRPEAGSPDQVVTLTATITKGTASTTKTFTLTVKAKAGLITPAHTATAEAATLTPVADADNMITLTVKNSAGNTDTTFTGEHNVTISGVSSVDGTYYGVFDGIPIGAGGTLTKAVTFNAGVATPILKLPKAAEQIISFSIAGVNTPQTNTLTLTPVPETPAFTVTFNLNGGTRTGGGELTQTVPSGGSATAPTVARSGYTFTAWDKVFTNITSDLTVTALWSQNSGSGSSYTDASLSVAKADFDKLSGKDVAVTVNRGSYTLKDLKNGSYVLEKGTDYTVSSSTIIIHAGYLDSLPEGKQLITFDMSGGIDPILTITIADIPFTDVTIDDWFASEIMWAYENGLIIGTSSTTFSPHDATTRGMIVTILYRLESAPAAAANPFSDVEADKYYTDAVTWAAENGVVSGYGNGNFGPEDPVTREQLAVILFNYAKFKGYDVSVGENTNIFSYEDAGKISEYAISAIQWACGAGILRGDGAKLDPQGNATRAQVAAMLMRFVENVVK
ncbi:MAG: S-layer homology domain-containing protein [Desulfitobacteriaceae bacterium]|nr:S-layer homology domain-containing protein [Desulfitobacteriaceae bacterium]